MIDAAREAREKVILKLVNTVNDLQKVTLKNRDTIIDLIKAVNYITGQNGTTKEVRHDGLQKTNDDTAHENILSFQRPYFPGE